MVTVVGVGIGSIDDLSKKAKETITKAKRLVTTASWHNVWQELPLTNSEIEVWDDLEISQRIDKLKGLKEDIVLVVAGDPSLDEKYFLELEDIKIMNSTARFNSLPLPNNWCYTDSNGLEKIYGQNTLVRVYPGTWEEIKKSLPANLKVYYENRLKTGQAVVSDLQISDGYVLIPKRFRAKPIDNLLQIMRRLRAPDGCPWDKEQTFLSLKPYIVEEAYELWDAVDSGDNDLIVEELGDVLLQVVFYCAIAEESDLFDFNQVAEVVSDKLIHRHPHVFGNVVADTPQEVMINWDAIKKREKGKEDRLSILDGVPKHLPGLSKAQKVQKKAAKVGFDWSEIEPVWDKVEEELKELKEAQDYDSKEEELGDLLFAIVNLARFLKIDPEVALTKTINKFQKRFRYIENHSGRPLEEMTLEEMDVFWEEAKKEDK